MKRLLGLLTTAALVVSLAACTGTGEEDTTATAEAGETYTGTVTEMGLDHLTLATEEGEIRIPYTEDTEFVGFGGMAGQPGGLGGGTPPEMGGAPAEPEVGGAAPENVGEPPAGPDNSGGSPAMGGPGQQASSYEDVSLNNEVTAVVGRDGIAETITLSGGGMGGGTSSAPEAYDAANAYTADTEVTGEALSSTGVDENAVLVGTEGITVSLEDVTISRISENSSGGDASSFYGVGTAALVTGGVLSIADSTITSNAPGGAGVFAYGGGTAYVSDTTISTQQDTSGGIHVAGGGALYAWDLTVETQGESSAAIRSDRGSGVMVVDGGSYTSNGTGSPAVYSTADITVHNAQLTANGSEAICIEGLNTIRLFDCTLTGNMGDLSQNDCTWNVILYQSMSGDSEVGNSTFEMVGGSLTAQNGGMFYTTNTESTFVLSGVEITHAADSEFLLKCTGNGSQRGWGAAGANGADCHFTALDQVLEGDVIWDSISQLDLYLTDGSTLTGAFVQDESNAGNGGGGYANLYLSADSTWVVTGDSALTSLSCVGTIVDGQGNPVSIVGTDGTAYISGSSAYTVTVEAYADSADLTGAASLARWADFAAESF